MAEPTTTFDPVAGANEVMAMTMQMVEANTILTQAKMIGDVANRNADAQMKISETHTKTSNAAVEGMAHTAPRA
jgi:hypothetical protein